MNLTIMHCYTAGWFFLCTIAALIFIRNQRECALLSPEYLRFIREPWKLITAFTATVGMTVMAPYTGDPTWDCVDAFFMSVLTWFTAPWCVGILYRFARGIERWPTLYIALCLWFHGQLVL